MQRVMLLIGMLGMAGFIEGIAALQAPSARSTETAPPKLTLAFTFNGNKGFQPCRFGPCPFDVQVEGEKVRSPQS